MLRLQCFYMETNTAPSADYFVCLLWYILMQQIKSSYTCVSTSVCKSWFLIARSNTSFTLLLYPLIFVKYLNCTFNEVLQRPNKMISQTTKTKQSTCSVTERDHQASCYSCNSLSWLLFAAQQLPCVSKSPAIRGSELYFAWICRLLSPHLGFFLTNCALATVGRIIKVGNSLTMALEPCVHENYYYSYCVYSVVVEL